MHPVLNSAPASSVFAAVEFSSLLIRIASVAGVALLVGAVACIFIPELKDYVWEWFFPSITDPIADSPSPSQLPAVAPVLRPEPRVPDAAGGATAAVPVAPLPRSTSPQSPEGARGSTTAAGLPPVSAVSQVKEASRDILVRNRQPLIEVLEKHFKLDDRGYPLDQEWNSSDTPSRAALKTPAAIDDLERRFRAVAEQGSAGYAHTICAFLEGNSIYSCQVQKAVPGTKLQDPVRAHSYAGGRQGTKVAPPTLKLGGYPAYISAWENAIWEGNRVYRENRFKMPLAVPGVKRKNVGQDSEVTEEQKDHYEASLSRIRNLHRQGLLLGRVATPEEAKAIGSHTPNMGNDILSTTLWPRENSPLEISLFCEFGAETVGLLLDPERTAPEDRGVFFKDNAGTVGSGFLNHKTTREDGAICLEAQLGLLQGLESVVSEGGDVRTVQISLKEPTRDGWDLKKMDGRNGLGFRYGRRGGAAADAPNKILWNEMTYYRGASGNLLTGLFVKSNSDNFSGELKRLFELQDHLRRTKGYFLPILRFDGAKNTLTEIPPDQLLLNILGLTGIPASERPSQLSSALQAAGITPESAIAMSRSLSQLSPGKDVLKALFDLQLLMFNLKDITGNVSVLNTGSNSYDQIRIIDNLHLVFPTIHKTQNVTAQSPELFFTHADIVHIQGTPALQNYLALALKENFKRFLSVAVDGAGQVAFSGRALSLFDAKDPKHTDFAKVLSRALQSAVLFNVFGDKTIEVVREITAQIRKELPVLGLLPTGVDMLLGSVEMQAILEMQEKPKDLLTKKLAPPLPPDIVAPTSFQGGTMDVNPLKPHEIKLPTSSEILKFLFDFGVNLDGSVDQKRLDTALQRDPLFIQSETQMLKALRFLSLLDPASHQGVMKNFRTQFPQFGFSAKGIDLSRGDQDSLVAWVQEVQAKSKPTTEFPFQALALLVSASPEAPAVAAPVRGHDHRRREGRRLARGGDEGEAFTVVLENSTLALSKSEELKTLFTERLDVQSDRDPRLPIAQKLGLVDKTGEWLWMKKPEFYLTSWSYKEDPYNPKAPFLAVTDMLGQAAVELMTGPAMARDVLKEDQDSVRVYIDPQIVPPASVERLMTHTLAVTTDGDKQVVFQNGNQYCRAAPVPSGTKDIKLHAGNEKYDFRRTEPRRFYNDGVAHLSDKIGAYDLAALQEVQDYERLLLSDVERRQKCAGLLMAGDITITAQGGFGSPRKPLDRAHKVFFINTYGPQFEKYKRGEFVALDGTRDANELEASDFIIKTGADLNPNPLFPDYYATKTIPAHVDVQKMDCAMLGDQKWDAEYVRLRDGSFFNGEAFKRATELTFDKRVVPVIQQRCLGHPVYVKATLFGGGFFANAGDAGDLRQEVIHAMVSAYVAQIKQDKFAKGSVIEFPRYGSLDAIDPRLKAELLTQAQAHGIEIVWSEEGDLCDFEEQQTLFGKAVDPTTFEKNGHLILLNAGDVMSWVGNEKSSASVEAMIANNSNLRLVFNWWANPLLLDPRTHILLGR